MKYFAVIIAVLVIIAGCKEKQKQLPVIKVSQFLVFNDSVNIRIMKGEELTETLYCAYGSVGTPVYLEPGLYTFSYRDKNGQLLSKRYGVANDGSYNLVLSGFSDGRYQETTSNRLLHIVEGAEALTANNFRPQLLIENNFFTVADKKSKLRFRNLIPGVYPVDITLVNAVSKDTLRYNHLKYPHLTASKSLESGNWHIEVKLRGTKKILKTHSLEIGTKELITGYLFPDIKGGFLHITLEFDKVGK
ncbi:DUF4397 domain-containing protein [Robertkochia aurantiaca]|uniref:DUF4397 domain-containing protein n=1 Tax=Robertkochia aurantiaca TaxID=2873700 RepID=UPI001CCB4381|nr:DUF4397 domain-containing protein [Robertkochia sp. 3YJGBD-33]